MALTLYGVKDSCRGLKVLAVAELTGTTLKVAPFSPDTDSNKPEFKQLSPLGRTPLISTEQGPIVGSGAITRYIARLHPEKGLYGQTFHQTGLVDMWVDFGQNELEVPLSAWVYPTIGVVEKNEQAMALGKENVMTVMEVMNKHLIGHTYLVGERLTIADICVAAPLVEAYKSVFDEAIITKFPSLFRWLHTVINKPAVAKVFGAVKLAKAAPTEDLSMNMDAWKRCYSNTKDLKGEAMKYFWEHYDPAHNSLWYMKYDKLEDECTVAFVASNQLGGFLQRFEPNMRKVSFGVIDVVGEEKNFDIQGVWLFKNNEIPFEMKDHPSYEFHTFRKLDMTKPADKQLVIDYWCNDDKVEGRTISDSKVWK